MQEHKIEPSPNDIDTPLVENVVEIILKAEEVKERTLEVKTDLTNPLDEGNIQSAVKWEQKSLKVKNKEQYHQHQGDLHGWRKKTLAGLASLTIVWTAFLMYVICTHLSFGRLSDTVLVAILTTTTATILGLFAIAANWLFPKDGNRPNWKK